MRHRMRRRALAEACRRPAPRRRPGAGIRFRPNRRAPESHLPRVGSAICGPTDEPPPRAAETLMSPGGRRTTIGLDHATTARAAARWLARLVATGRRQTEP